MDDGTGRLTKLFIPLNLKDKFTKNKYIKVKMFEFFRFGFFPGLFHLLYMATLPLALLYAFGGQYFLGGIIFFLGAPLFRSLRNSSLGL
tara:strand:- start:1572 stop:1838 length:267 start_codon:yes stop_codon:yes gene_type:complete